MEPDDVVDIKLFLVVSESILEFDIDNTLLKSVSAPVMPTALHLKLPDSFSHGT